jgi:thiamine kinase-like enzyme
MSPRTLPRTAEELRTVLGRFPGLSEKVLDVKPVLGGLTNSNWRVDVDGEAESYFVKVPGPGTEAFVDRATATAASRQAAEMGVGPDIVYCDAETGIEVSEFLEGYQPCTAWDVGRPDVCAQLMHLFRMWNSGPVLPQTKTVFDMVDEHREQVLRDGTVMPGWVLEVLAAYDDAKARFLASGLDIVPCHNDPGAGNYMRSITDPGKPMRLIDYDYASNNERAYEIAVFVGFNFFDEVQTRHAIESYFGHFDSRMWARVQVIRAVADVKWGLWGLVNARAWAGDFDYYKYGLWDLRRAQYEILAPDWPTQLSRL